MAPKKKRNSSVRTPAKSKYKPKQIATQPKNRFRPLSSRTQAGVNKSGKRSSNKRTTKQGSGKPKNARQQLMSRAKNAGDRFMRAATFNMIDKPIAGMATIGGMRMGQ